MVPGHLSSGDLDRDNSNRDAIVHAFFTLASFLLLDDRDEAAFIVPVVSGATAADPRLAGRLSLWGRRLMGEALSQGQVVAGEREALANLLVGAGADLTWVGEMFARLRERHQVRMTRLGLTP